MLVSGHSIGDTFGQKVAGGYLDGDGFSDIAVSAPGYDPTVGSEDVGIFLFRGAPELATGTMSAHDATTRVFAEPSNAEPTLYGGLALGDTSGDGVADLLVCDYFYNLPEERWGRCWLDFGPLPAGDVAIDDFEIQFEPSVNGTLLGFSVASADYDGDGLGDFIAGAPGHRFSGLVSPGRIYIWLSPFEPPETTESANAAFESPQLGAKAGRAISAADLDSDGRAEIVVGAPYDQEGGTDAGKVYVIPGGAGLP